MTVRHHRVMVGDTGIHAVVAGEGPPIVLLHGWPVTWYHWREIIPMLARSHAVIAPDLRGLGDSDRPRSGYDKRTLARDVLAVADHFGLNRFAVAGHDFGGSVAYALAVDNRDRVSHLLVMEEMLPGFPVPPGLVSTRYPRWHNAFHSVPDIPEMLIAGHEREHLCVFWSRTGPGSALSSEAVDEYARTYLTPGALRVGLAYYRTAAADTAFFRGAAEAPLTIPTLAIGGDTAMGSAVEASMRQVADAVTGTVIDDCGHYPAEERPGEVVELIEDFISACR
jgi:pimeloyl-ACP methyl ester carboxylesterase